MKIHVKRSINISLSFTLLLLSVSSYAAEQAAVPVSYSSNLVQMMLGLMATVAMIFVVVWLIKRVGYTGYGVNNAMQIKSTLPLSPKEKLLLVEVEGEKILIGVAPGFVGHVKTLENKGGSEIVNNASEETTHKAVTNGFSSNKVVNDLSSSFAEKLKAVLNKPEDKKGRAIHKEEITG